MEKFDVKMDSFYEFLCSSPLDDMQSIRKMYNFYRCFAIEYSYTIHQYNCNYKLEKSNDWDARKSLEKEHNNHHIMIRLMHDSYLAILLQRLDFDKYEHIIKGLYGYFKYSNTNISSVNPPLKDKYYKTEECILTKKEYIEDLIISNHFSTHEGDYLFTPSLGSIVEIEKELIKPDEKVKCLRLKQEIPYGDLRIFRKNSCK